MQRMCSVLWKQRAVGGGEVTLQEIFQVQENYKLPDAIMEVLLSKEAEKYIRVV